MDEQVCLAFDNLVQWAGNSTRLGEIASQPKGEQELIVSDRFRDYLAEQDFRVLREETRNYTGQKNYRHDIVVIEDSESVAVIEIKTPFTNHDGIRNKTRKLKHLPKDMDALKAALEGGAAVAYTP